MWGKQLPSPTCYRVLLTRAKLLVFSSSPNSLPFSHSSPLSASHWDSSRTVYPLKFLFFFLKIRHINISSFLVGVLHSSPSLADVYYILNYLKNIHACTNYYTCSQPEMILKYTLQFFRIAPITQFLIRMYFQRSRELYRHLQKSPNRLYPYLSTSTGKTSSLSLVKSHPGARQS